MDIVRRIRSIHGSARERQSYALRHFPDFCERYERLLGMACEDHFDLNNLEYMLRMREAIRGQQMTVDQASAQVGQVFFDRFVQPKLSDPAQKKDEPPSAT